MACNMKCLHCFNGDAFIDKAMLDVKEAIKFMELACKEYSLIKVTFHGGEPTLAGYDFYKAFFTSQRQLISRYNVKVRNIITTNGLLLTDKLIELFKENFVQICVSYDGPYNYVLRQNSEKVLNNILRAKDSGADVKCYCTISKQSVKHLEEIYYWFRNHRINFKTLPIEKRGYAINSTELVMPIEDLVNNFARTYLIWIKDTDCKVSYSTFEEFANLRRATMHRKFWFGRKIALNSDGNLYTFGRPNDIKFSIGSVWNVKSLSNCFESKCYVDFLSYLKEKRNVKCKNCKSNIICGGVNINIAYLYVDDENLVDYSCAQSDALFQRILEINDNIIMDFQHRNIDDYNEYVKNAFAEFID